MVLDAEPSPQVRIPAGGLDNVARAIGAVVDVKSPFLVGHSNRVSELAVAAAERAMFFYRRIDVRQAPGCRTLAGSGSRRGSGTSREG